MTPSTGENTQITVVHEPERERYEALAGDEIAAVLYYADETDAAGESTGVRDLRSTIVSPERVGRGIGSQLVHRAVDDARADGLQLRATCWFAHGWLTRHPENLDLLVPGSSPTLSALAGDASEVVGPADSTDRTEVPTEEDTPR